ncbi:MAG: T9SS type A sorting domain-containing protein, partial [Bacteroidetes bacterium]
SANNNTLNPNVTSVSVKVNLSNSDTIVAHFVPVGVPELLSLQPLVSAFPTVTSNAVVIQYSLPEAMPVSMKLYSILGSQLVEISNPQKTVPAGNHAVEINLSGSKLPAGMYMLNFIAGKYKKTIKLIYSPQ